MKSNQVTDRSLTTENVLYPIETKKAFDNMDRLEEAHPRQLERYATCKQDIEENEDYEMVSTACPYVEAANVIENFLIPIITGIGIVTNTLCIVVFAKVIKDETKNTSGHMFKYLLCKAIHDDIQFICSIFSVLYYCTTCASYGTYAAQIWYIWFYWYMTYINSVCSGFLEVAATFDCLITINQKMTFCKKTIWFVLVVLGTLLYTGLFYTFKLFEFHIGKYPKEDHGHHENSTASGYYYFYEYTSFHNSQPDKAFKVVHGVTRDVITLVVIVILNGLILISVKNKMARKKKLTSISVGTANQNASKTESSMTQHPTATFSVNGAPKTREKLSRADRAAAKATTMVIMIGVNYLIGHGLMFVYYCFLINPSVFKSCLFNLALALLFLSFATPFFIYLFFNKNFKAKFLEVFVCSKPSTEAIA